MAKIDLPTEYPDGMTEAMIPHTILFHFARGNENH
jgi:hypothetical protein